ncbi:uncharacterized protein Pyn_39450 [Prunus yedoensis var. nudiflora]|uniref:Uncharacterized protein n=1 Tax=Prunus yedoensis var. nudiflora TaxID=2094558 RepID=A0A314YYU5_PRUYE|nr:uncharacterized protein Pyn_39450 [Prunus yedoensis var. nudiflora]
MLVHVKRYFKEHKEIVNGICDAPEEAYQFIQGWEKSQQQGFNGSTIMSGWLGFVSGSGGPLVWKYLESCMHNMSVRSSEELFQNVKRAVFYATLFDPYSGGYVRDDYEYTHDINMKVNQGFKMHFDEETYLRNVVIKQGTPYIVRLVHFKRPIDEIYENLKRKNSQRIVPREVQDLQSVEIEEIGKAPILCGKLSEELVRIVQHL